MPDSDWHEPLPKELPRPSYAPALMALGLMFLLWGAVTTWLLSFLGLLLVGFASAQWIRGAGVSLAPSATATKRKRETSTTARSTVDAATPALQRYSAFVAACALVAVLTGATLTSKASPASVHIVTGSTTGILALGLALWLWRVDLRLQSGLLLAIVLLGALLSGGNPAVATLHAFFAQLLFAAVVSLMHIVSAGRKPSPETVPDIAWPSLRMLAPITVAAVVLQVALGAAVRHRTMGAGLHITFALLVALLILLEGVLTLNQYPAHPTLRPYALAMMTTTGVQVFLGFGAFIVRMMAEDATPAVIVTTAAHVTTGALTLAAVCLMALQIRRHLRRKEA
jgi:heme A synthase